MMKRSHKMTHQILIKKITEDESTWDLYFNK